MQRKYKTNRQEVSQFIYHLVLSHVHVRRLSDAVANSTTHSGLQPCVCVHAVESDTLLADKLSQVHGMQRNTGDQPKAHIYSMQYKV